MCFVLQRDLKYSSWLLTSSESGVLLLYFSLHSEVELKWSDNLHLLLQSTPSWVGRGDLSTRAGTRDRN